MKQVAEQCHRLQHCGKLSHPQPRRYAELISNDFYELSGAFKDIIRIDHIVQESRLRDNPYSVNWTRQEFDDLICSISNSPNMSHVPCMFTNDWNRNWSINDYYESLREIKSDCGLTVKVGHGDDGMNMKWHDFMEYLDSDCLGHDHPLYVIDDDFHLNLSEFTMTYSMPAPFAWTVHHDVFSHIPDADRPPYRWFVLGGWRSGSPLHTDPYCSSAWNVNIRGRKRWIIFPGDYLTEKSDQILHRILCGEVEWDGLYSPSPVLEWFVEAYPSLVDYRNGIKQGECDDIFDNFYEFIQNPGDMVYVPAGWAHTVLNLEETVAVTHNFTTKQEQEMVMKKWREHM